MKVHLTGTNLERPAVYNWRASHISHVMTSCSATCRVTSAMYSHHRVSKPDSDTAQCGWQKAILSLFLSWDCRSRYVNRSLYTFFIESKEFVFYLPDWPSMYLLAAHEALSEFKRLRNYESSGTIRFICITHDANEEKTGIGANAQPMIISHATERSHLRSTVRRPCFRITLDEPRARSVDLIDLNLNCDRVWFSRLITCSFT